MLNINFSESVYRKSNSQTLLHTCVGSVKGKDTKFLIDPGSDTTIVTEKFVNEMNLERSTSRQIITVQTLNGKSTTTSVTASIPIMSGLIMEAFIVKSLITLNETKISLKKVWPGLEKNLYIDAKKNMTHEKLDILVGMDNLYTKLSHAKIVSHPTLGLVLKNTAFGWSLIGSLSPKLDFDYFKD